MTLPPNDSETRRKRLLWRASHRGTKELDLVLGGFVRDRLRDATPDELDELEALVGLPDPQLAAWISGEERIEHELQNRTTERFLAYRIRHG
jgi:antitoxin CptB